MTNRSKYVRSEPAKIIYEKPIYPKKRHWEAVPPKCAKYEREVIEKCGALMQKCGVWKKPPNSLG
jgi:beta-ureidopropionase